MGGLTFFLLATGVVGTDALRVDLERIARELQSDNPFERADAAHRLRENPTPETTELLLQALSDPSPMVRAAAAGALISHRHPSVPAALTQRLSDTNQHVRAYAVWSLASVGGRPALPAVVDRARHDPANVVRFRAVWGLAHIGDPAGLPVAIEALGDRNVSVRERAAVNAIESLADQTVSRRLAPLAGHPQAGTRRLVMYLYTLYPSRGGTALVRAGLADADVLVRGEAALSLGKLKDRTVLPAILDLLADPDEHVRGSAAYAVGLIGDRSVRDQLRPLLVDEAAFVRAIAAESMQLLGDDSVKPPNGFRARELFTFPMFSPMLIDPTDDN